MKKNILFVIPDQLRADFLGCYGAGFVNTPNIDALRAEGILFNRAISPSPLCVPARASLLTGANAMVNGVMENSRWLRPDHKACGVKTWPEELSESGYYTAAIGKMHFYPWDISEGFNERRISEDKRHIHVEDDYFEYLKSQGLEKKHGSEYEGYYQNKGAVVSDIPAEHHVDRWVAEQAIDFLENYDGDRPFAAMVGFPGPHCPYDPPPEYLDQVNEGAMPDCLPATAESEMFRDFFIRMNKLPWNGVDYSDFTEEQKRKLRRHYVALINQIDHEFGRIIDTLKQKGIYDDTTIIFTSDHGDLMGDFNLMAKHYYFEGSIQVPMIIKDNSFTAGSTWNKSVSLTDLYATIKEIAGLESHASSEDSLSLFRQLGTGGAAPSVREPIFGVTDLGYMLTDDDWKLCRHENGAQMLYNLKEDPAEQHNRFEDPAAAEVLRNLDRTLTARIVRSMNRSHEEKIVQKTNAIGDGGFEKREWLRPYPMSPAPRDSI